jgi:hypothetical protein
MCFFRPATVAILFLTAAALAHAETAPASVAPAVLHANDFKHYIDTFNRDDEELYREMEAIPNARAWDFLKDNIPLLDCPDQAIEETYYFRWWTFRKHIRATPEGYIITEFLPAVPWAGKENSINCAAGFHITEGRWLHDPKYVEDYLRFWFRPDGGNPRQYSTWIAYAAWQHYLVGGDAAFAKKLLPALIANYGEWEKSHRDPNGLFWQTDDMDGMEMSIGGSGYRATINSYMFGDALGISELSGVAGQTHRAEDFVEKFLILRNLVQDKLWDKQAAFFKVLPRAPGAKLVSVREEHGFTPWYFGLPVVGDEAAWKQLVDPQGFRAPFGPTTAEQRDPHFAISYAGHECQWNGPSWPYATSITLGGLANLLDDYPPQSTITKQDYFDLLTTYTKSQRRIRADGTVLPWIDEDLNPQTGDWISRTLLLRRQQAPRERGKDYNHSLYADLIITGLIGLRPNDEGTVDVRPLVPPAWNWFCLDNVLYHGRIVTILYDKTGGHYHHGTGLQILANGKSIAHAANLAPLQGTLP